MLLKNKSLVAVLSCAFMLAAAPLLPADLSLINSTVAKEGGGGGGGNGGGHGGGNGGGNSGGRSAGLIMPETLPAMATGRGWPAITPAKRRAIMV